MVSAVFAKETICWYIIKQFEELRVTEPLKRM